MLMASYTTSSMDTGYRPAPTLQHAIFETVDWLQANEAAQPYEASEGDTNVVALCRAFGEELRKVLGDL